MTIIKSLLDIDFYKFTMGQLVFKRYPNIDVKYSFKNRSDVKLAKFINMDELRQELDCAKKLRFNNSELHYLRGTNEYGERMFCENYLEFLKNLRLPDYFLAENNEELLKFTGKWSEVIYWETIALTIVNELYFRALMNNLSDFEKDVRLATGKILLAEKIKKLREYPEITFADFGTRRRFSKEWHDYIVKTLAEELPKQFLGTSNTYLAMKYGLLPIGTSAHEMYMVLAGLGKNEKDIQESHNRVLNDWWDEYGWGLSIALTDTFGTKFFFNDMTQEQAKNWKGLRHDSGDPFNFANKAINFYERFNIDPKDKLVIFSDGLDIDTIIKLYAQFNGKIKTSYGWGTNLTNDLGFKTLSIVIKPTEANGNGLVKLSDNIAKAIGRKADVALYKKIFNYNSNFYEQCKY